MRGSGNFARKPANPFVEYARRTIDKATDCLTRALPERVIEAKHLFDPNALTLGFARRFAAYKRPNMLLHDPERLLASPDESSAPVQLILAGKAHPADSAGQALLQEWIHFIRRSDARCHVIYP